MRRSRKYAGTRAARCAYVVVLCVVLFAGVDCDLLPSGGGDIMEVVEGDQVLSVGEPLVTVIEYSGFRCGYCTRFALEEFPAIREAYVDTGKVRWVFRHFTTGSTEPEEASECAGDQGVYLEYHDVLYENRSALTNADLKSYASDLGLDRAVFDACLDGGGKASDVRDDTAMGVQAGVWATPAFLIDGELQLGFLTAEEFGALLDAAITAAGG